MIIHACPLCAERYARQDTPYSKQLPGGLFYALKQKIGTKNSVNVSSIAERN
jgi:hypothetical protein